MAEAGATARLFFAVTLPAELRGPLEQVQDQLRRSRARVKWVEPHNLHFTVKFLGEMPLATVPGLLEVAGQVADGREAFELALRGVGAFPRPAEPRVIWVGSREGARELEALATELDEALARAGLAARETRPFKAHLTLGRAREPREARGLEEPITAMAEQPLGLLRVTRVVLLQSDLRREGPVYSEVGQVAVRDW